MGALSRESVGMVFTREMIGAGDELVIRVDTASSVGTPVVRLLRWERVG